MNCSFHTYSNVLIQLTVKFWQNISTPTEEEKLTGVKISPWLLSACTFIIIVTHLKCLCPACHLQTSVWVCVSNEIRREKLHTSGEMTRSTDAGYVSYVELVLVSCPQYSTVCDALFHVFVFLRKQCIIKNTRRTERTHWHFIFNPILLSLSFIFQALCITCLWLLLILYSTKALSK